jgi:hypothetical protein
LAKKPAASIRSYGIYHHWDADSKELPDVREFTERVPAEIDIEFGFVVNIKHAKNQELGYCIDHPGIKDDQGRRRAPFDGTVYIKTNDWDFYLGDTIWEPIDDKLGPWRMYVELDNKIIAEKTFEVFQSDDCAGTGP